MKKKFYFIVPFLILVLIFSFACGGTPKEVTKTEEKEPELPEKVIEEEIIEEPIEEMVEEATEADIEAEYTANSLVISAVKIDSMEKFGQAISDIINGDISMTEFKLITKEYIGKINSCYDMYLKLEPSKRLEKAHVLNGKAMEHYLNSTTFLKSYIESDDIEDKLRYLEQSIAEINLGNEYTEKATKEVEKLTE